MSSTFPTCATHHCVMHQRWSNGVNASPVWICPMCENAILAGELQPTVKVVYIVAPGRCSNCGAVCALCASTDEGAHPGRSPEAS